MQYMFSSRRPWLITEDILTCKEAYDLSTHVHVIMWRKQQYVHTRILLHV